MSYLTEQLSSEHNKTEFDCGKAMLNDYFHKQAGQDIKRKLSACFVLIEKEKSLIKGYYTLSNNSIPLDDVPEIFKKKLPPSYTSIPTTLLGRLAVDKRFQRMKIGEMLLIDALKRSFEVSKTIGSFAVVVFPLDDDARSFYMKYGFIQLPDSGKMFLPMNTIRQLF